jgi:hypothetical protein
LFDAQPCLDVGQQQLTVKKSRIDSCFGTDTGNVERCHVNGTFTVAWIGRYADHTTVRQLHPEYDIGDAGHTFLSYSKHKK